MFYLPARGAIISFAGLGEGDADTAGEGEAPLALLRASHAALLLPAKKETLFPAALTRPPPPPQSVLASLRPTADVRNKRYNFAEYALDNSVYMLFRCVAPRYKFAIYYNIS